MDVAFDCADNHTTDAGRAGFGQEWLEDGHATLHCVGGEQNFGHEENTITEVLPNDCHTADKSFCQDAVGRPITAQEDVYGFFDFLFEAIVKIVKHLLDKFVVVQICEDDVFFVRHGGIL